MPEDLDKIEKDVQKVKKLEKELSDIEHRISKPAKGYDKEYKRKKEAESGMDQLMANLPQMINRVSKVKKKHEIKLFLDVDELMKVSEFMSKNNIGLRKDSFLDGLFQGGEEADD